MGRWVGCFFAALALAQSPDELMREPAVRAALEAVKRDEPRTLELQARLCEIAAPPFHEQARGREVKLLFDQLGLRDVRMDAAGNVIGTRPGRSAHPSLVFAAHLDTVFPEGTAVKVTRAGGAMKGPGIGDDARGLAVMLAVIRGLNEARVETPGSITFVADVGEEGMGDLRGMKALFGGLKERPEFFVSVDAVGLGIVNRGVGSLRYKVTFRGPGGHSYASFGVANPIQAMGRAIAGIDALEVPAEPRTTFSVGRVSGGTSVNAIPSEAWMEVDLRSTEESALKALDARFREAVNRAVEEENRRWNGRGAVRATIELAGNRPAGMTAAGSHIVETAAAVSRALGIDAELAEASTDANLPMNLGIPAVTIGGGGSGAGAHTAGETFDPKDSWLGTQRALLLAVALAR